MTTLIHRAGLASLFFLFLSVANLAHAQQPPATEAKSTDVKPPPAASGAETSAPVPVSTEKASAPAKGRPGVSTPDTYVHEVNGWMNFDMSTGNVKDAATSASTEIGQTLIGMQLGYGYLINDNLEPLLEVQFKQDTRTVDKFTREEQTMDIAFGLLVNLPVVSKPASARDAATQWNVPAFMRAKWIPYIGFLAGFSQSTADQGDASKSKFSDDGTFTKIVFGARYMIFDHVALNSSVRVLYESNNSSAEGATVAGADGSKLRIETRLLSLSMFL